MKPTHGWPPHKPRTPLEPQDASLLVQVRCWAGSMETWAAGDLWVCGSRREHPRAFHGCPQPAVAILPVRRSVSVPQSSFQCPLVGMVTTGLQISVGGAAATITSRKIPGFSPAC